ncbi:MAG: Fic family protein [Deltaproteobacteria bacterium]|nr:Fic family protein [Deltaproteobacteria bacterium]
MMQHDPMDGMLTELDRRAESVRHLMARSSGSLIAGLWKSLDVSTIYHDWALEGQVVSASDLDNAFDYRAVTDASSLGLYLALRSHRWALHLARETAARKKLVYSVSLFKEFHAFFSGDSDGGAPGRYRKEIPLHRSYFHEICAPDAIGPNMRKLVQWLNDPDEAAELHPVLWASKFHYRFMRIFPYADVSGKVGRVMMNMVLIRNGYLPAVIHATERQRYYECIRQPQQALTRLILESALSSVEATGKMLSGAAAAS